jgi:aromatic ring-opening dioxygenase catalytic subunit (LigB family)
MFAKAFHSMIKGIHLTLEMKTSFGNSTPMMGYSTESSTYKHVLPLTVIIGIAEKKRKRICTQKVTKQSLSDYAQQD